MIMAGSGCCCRCYSSQFRMKQNTIAILNLMQWIFRSTASLPVASNSQTTQNERRPFNVQCVCDGMEEVRRSLLFWGCVSSVGV